MLSQACMLVLAMPARRPTTNPSGQGIPLLVKLTCMLWQAYPRIYDATLRASAVLQKLCKGGMTTLDMGNMSSRTTAGQCAYLSISQATTTDVMWHDAIAPAMATLHVSQAVT